MHCPNCSEENVSSEKFCKKCGENFSQILSETKEKHDTRNSSHIILGKDLKWLIAAGCVVMTIAIGVAGFWARNSQPDKSKQPVNTGTKTEQLNTNNETPAQTSTSEKTDTPADKLNEKYSEIVNKYDKMSVDEFELLQIDERLLYSQLLIDKTLASGTYENMYGDGKIGHDYRINYVPVSTDNNGQEIITDNTYLQQMSSLQSNSYVTVVNGKNKTFNAINGEKILSSVYYGVGKTSIASGRYAGVKNFYDTLEAPTYQSNTSTATNTSELLKGTDDKGDTIKYKIVTYYTKSAQTLYARFIYHEFTSYDGSRKAVWLFDNQSANPTDIK